MKFCKYCGSRIDENAIFCSKCGARVSGDNPHVNFSPFDRYNPGYSTPVDTQGSMLIAIVSFLCWQAGLVIWFLWRYSHPGKARSAAKGALANACVSMPILGFVLWLIFREEENRHDYAKVCGISAIVGASFYVLSAVLFLILKLIGVSFFISLPLEGMVAAILSLVR